MRPFELTLEEIEAIVRPLRAEGTLDQPITGIAGIDQAKSGDITFFENAQYVMQNSRYDKFIADCHASIILLPENFSGATPKPNQRFLYVKKVSLAFGLVCQRVEQLLFPKPTPGIHPSAVVDREAQVASSASIGPLCVVGPYAQIHKDAVLGAGSYVGAHAVVGHATELKPGVRILDDCEVGARCILHSGVVIGSDGYGFAFYEGKHLKVPQIGNVVVEDDVEIGANTTIDRARFGTTRIGQGTKIDNLVQVAHNVTVGKHCLLVAQSAIAGSTTLGDYVVLGGQAGVSGHLKIASQVQIAAQAGVNHSQDSKETLWGVPAMEFKQGYRIEALKRRLPELFKRMTDIEEHLGQKNERKNKAAPGRHKNKKTNLPKE